MKKEDLAVITLVPLIIFIAIMFFDLQVSYLVSLLLLFGIPIVYLAYKERKKLKKISLYSVIIAIPVAVAIDFVGMLDNGWYVAKSSFPFRFFIIPIEDFIWMISVVFIIVLFYEHFIKKDQKSTVNKEGLKLLAYILYPIALAVLLLFIINPDLITFPYAFFWSGFVFFFIPAVVFLTKYPKYILNFFKTGIYSFYIFLLVELVGLKLDHWVYEGSHYIGWVNFFGLRFPFEEFFYVMIIGTFACLSYYEFFMNKYKR